MKLLKILTFILLLAIGTDMVSGLWADAAASAVVLEKEEDESSKKSEPEQPEAFDKFVHSSEVSPHTGQTAFSFRAKPVYLSSAAYLSLPEIPPELA